MMKKPKFSRSILPLTAALLALGIGAGNPALAQGDEQLEEVVVTGSRIVRRDFESNSPILTVGEELLEQTFTSSIESNLNKLPQFIPDKTPDQGGDIQPTATNTPGSATVSLRNLGANRSLVLLDGRRATPGNASMVVDINTIPAFAIDRVEIITGGASATYGADAVGGVTNFIMKKNFEGFQIGSQAGITERGDALEWNLSGILGTNFADGRGNIMLSMSTNRREEALRRDRSWFEDFYKDPNRGGTEFFPDFSAVDFDFGDPSQAAVDSIFGAAAAVSPADRFYVNADGTLFTGFFQSFSTGGVSRFDGDTTGIKWKETANGLLAQNFVNELLTLPLERQNLFARGNYEINDWLGVFAQGMFNDVSVHTVQQPSPSVNGWAAYIPNDGRTVPAEVQTLLNGRVDPTQDWRLTYYLDYADRTSSVDVTTYNLMAGFEGSIPSTDWTWEAYVSQGESETAALEEGFASLERFRAVISSPNWGAGFSAQGNPLFGGFGASTGTCTSGFNPFDLNQAISADCIEAISADIKTRSTMTQTVYEANAQGGLFDLPAGELRGAIGLSRRENEYRFLNDTLTTQGRSFLDQAIGLYPSGNSAGAIEINEVYGELLVPILADAFYIKKFDLELGGRHSDYNTTGGSWTYKILSDLTINDQFRLRGGFNRAERAPNVAELFLAPQQTFVFSAGGDPCSLNSRLAWSANPASNPTNAAAVQALCTTIMEASAPGTAATFYGNATFQTSGGTFAFPTLQGNPTVAPETADTWTVGLVMDSPIDYPLLETLRMTIDYYNISVENAIGPQSIDVAQQQCFSTEYNPTLSVTSPYCAGINRVANDGAIGNIITTYYNNGRFTTDGIDFQLDWGMDIGPGTFNINSLTNYLLKLKSSELPGNVGIDYAGSLGPSQNGLNPGSYEWKMLNTFSYNWDKYLVSLQWRHLPSIDSASIPAVPTATTLGAGSYDLISLNGGIELGESILGSNLSIRFGIENLFDQAPPVLEVNSAPPPGTLAGGGFSSSAGSYFYDLQGRRFYLGANFEF
jgi:iron complex outermembrane receptor protein